MKAPVATLSIIAAAGCLLTLPGCATRRAPATAPAAAAAVGVAADPRAAAALDQLIESYFDASLALAPTEATARGFHGYDDRMENTASAAWQAQRSALARDDLAQLRRIDPARLDARALLTRDFFIDHLERRIEAARFPQYLLPVNQIESMAERLARFGSGSSAQPFATVADYDRFLARCDDFLAWVDSAIAALGEGAHRGVTLPQVVIARVPPQLRGIAVADVERSVFWNPIAALPADFPAAERARLTAAWRAKIGGQVLPAYRRLADYIEQDYVPAARRSVGWSALPDGAAWYRQRVRESTTLDISPDELHAQGLAEVARIRGEMEAVRQRVGFQGDLPAFLRFVESDPRFRFTSGEQMLDAYRTLKLTIDARLPRLFRTLPKADYEIRAIEPFRAASVPGGQYQRPSPDGRRPGIFYVNTHDLRSLPNYISETLSLHEASPGHHFQGTVVQEQTNLPRLRRFESNTAYVEGWALYAESLGKELGLFEDPYQWYGHLTESMLRAMRLVVDTGLHARGWSREQAIAYMLANSSMSEDAVRIEVDRYIIWPGQALAYKTGELAIRRLRQRAERELGADFDVRDFHDQVLLDGALPLTVLEAKIGRWIAAQRH